MRRRRATAEWKILDVAGTHVATHVRMEPGSKGRAKEFVWRAPDGTIGLNGLSVKELPLYGVDRLPADAAVRVVVVEGEKAADALLSWGIPAVGTVTGAGSCPSVERLTDLAGRPVVLWPDADDPGQKHMTRVAEGLKGLACEVRCVDIQRWQGGFDAADFVGSDDELRCVVETARRLSTGNETREWTKKGAQGSVPMFEEPEPWPEPVDARSLLDELEALLVRYLVLPRGASVAIPAWVLHTWTCHSSAEMSPRLNITSPTMRCGKSNVLKVIHSVVRRPLKADQLTAAVAFRLVEKYKPTILLDEADAQSASSRSTAGLFFSTWAPLVAIVTHTVSPCCAMSRRAARQRW